MILTDVDHVSVRLAVASDSDVIKPGRVRPDRVGAAVGGQEPRQGAMIIEFGDALASQVQGAVNARSMGVQQAPRNPCSTVVGEVVAPDLALIEGLQMKSSPEA